MDIKWWLDFLPSWNGVCFIQSGPTTAASLSLYTDASSLGFGGVFGTHWFSVPCPSHFLSTYDFHINVLELFAIVAAVVTWGHSWRDQQIILFTDNDSIVQVWKSGSCKDKDIMTLVRFCFRFLNVLILTFYCNTFLVIIMLQSMLFLVYRSDSFTLFAHLRILCQRPSIQRFGPSSRLCLVLSITSHSTCNSFYLLSCCTFLSLFLLPLFKSCLPSARGCSDSLRFILGSSFGSLYY